MRRIWRSVLSGICLLVIAVQPLAAQTAYETVFVTALTLQNIGTATATLEMLFFVEMRDDPIVVSRELPAGAGDSLFVGGLTGSEALPPGFFGSTQIRSDQPLVATAVQIPQPVGSTFVKNRPLSNAVGFGGSELFVASVLRQQFHTNTILSIQNTDSVAVDIKLRIYDAERPLADPVEVDETDIPVGAARYYDFGATDFGGRISTPFNGSAVVTATRAGSSVPGVVAATVVELQIDGPKAIAYEGLPIPASTVYMATALCDVFGGQTTYYAIQNTSRVNSTNVTVNYSNGISASHALSPGSKVSVNTCDATGMPTGFSGAARISSTSTDIVVIGKVSGAGRLTGFVGESAGAAQVYLPYVRWTSDSHYETGSRQRTFIALQNIGDSGVTNVQVRYLDKVGDLVGTHIIDSIPAGSKANSRAVDADGNAARLLEFGNPDANPGGGFGGAVIIEGPSGADLIALARVTSNTDDGEVAEDYNGMTIGSGTLYVPYTTGAP